MKKMLVVLPLAVLLLTLTIGITGAAYDYEDPALCVAGKWLLVNAAHPAAITVFVPDGTPYGDWKAGGCEKRGKGLPQPQVVKEHGEGNIMHVAVDGKNASTPEVKVSYGDTVQTQTNKGTGMLNFQFNLPND